jgi:hypothetical protein
MDRIEISPNSTIHPKYPVIPIIPVKLFCLFSASPRLRGEKLALIISLVSAVK